MKISPYVDSPFVLNYFSDSILRCASSDFKRMGRRIFVFIVGGATRSEVFFNPHLPFYLMFPVVHISIFCMGILRLLFPEYSD